MMFQLSIYVKYAPEDIIMIQTIYSLIIVILVTNVIRNHINIK